MAIDRDQVEQAVTGTFRFDVVVADLVWNRPELEFAFDGLDVIDLLGRAGRPAPVILATQGHSMEQDLIDEARLRPEVVGIFPKSSGVDALLEAIEMVAVGKRLPESEFSRSRPPLYELFQTGKGATAARMAGAIAAGRATDSNSLLRVTSYGKNTVNKVTNQYIGPIMIARGEHDPSLPLTLGAVYRWCGLHARYLLSWCRRNGNADVLRPEHLAPTQRPNLRLLQNPDHIPMSPDSA
ncbi:response regulator [Nocardia elegans]|uniref:Response regulator n=1 Tax=Nocardia elegans TaxID=300029 RepID=A0ABW6TN70_9NOCA|nr:response regulator [Nocardia elegans]